MITINYVYGFRFSFWMCDVEDENIDFYGKIVYCRIINVQFSKKLKKGGEIKSRKLLFMCAHKRDIKAILCACIMELAREEF